MDTIYENQGFIVARSHADYDFQSTVEGLRNDGKLVSFNLANAQEHQPHAERNNRTIQERVRAVVHSLPYHAMPNALINSLVPEVTRRLNFFH